MMMVQPLFNSNSKPICSEEVKVKFIRTEKGIQMLEQLIGADLVGMDLRLNAFESENPSIFQIASEDCIFFIDLK